MLSTLQVDTSESTPTPYHTLPAYKLRVIGEKGLSIVSKPKLDAITLCVVAVKKKHYLDPSSKVVPFENWIKDAFVTDHVKYMTTKAFGIFTAHDLMVPYIEYLDGGLLLTFDNDGTSKRRLVYINVTKDGHVRYQIANKVVRNFEWRTIPLNVNPTHVFFRVAQHVSESEVDCTVAE